MECVFELLMVLNWVGVPVMFICVPEEVFYSAEVLMDQPKGLRVRFVLLCAQQGFR